MLRRFKYTISLLATLAGATASGLSGAWIPPSHPWLWPVREGLAWLAGGLVAGAIIARGDRR